MLGQESITREKVPREEQSRKPCKSLSSLNRKDQVMCPFHLGRAVQPSPPAARPMSMMLTCKKVRQVSVAAQAVHHIVPPVPRQLLTIRVLPKAESKMDKAMIHFFSKPHRLYRIVCGAQRKCCSPIFQVFVM